MIATVINAAAVVVGTLLGVLLHRAIGDRFRHSIYSGIGVMTLVIGFSMALGVQRVLYFALALVIGGVLGTWWRIEDGVLKLGEVLKNRFQRRDGAGQFAFGFLSASVIFCVGAMTIVGSFQAGAEGNYELLLTKSVMDGAMSVLLASVMGPGVGFSALMILLYQGALTLLSSGLKPLITELLLSEITAVGGALVVMIGINLLELRKIRTADFVPALLVVIVFVALDPFLAPLFGF
jgi:uncharacterized protein